MRREAKKTLDQALSPLGVEEQKKMLDMLQRMKSGLTEELAPSTAFADE